MSFMSGFGNALGFVGGALNGITGVTEQQERTYKQQQQAMAQQNAYNYRMWDLQNQYNSPAAQLARMREAGIDINPTSYALGTGNLSNTATFVGSENGFAGSGSPAGNPISMALGVASGIMDVKYKKAMVDSVEANTQNLTNFLKGKGNSTFNPQIQKVVNSVPEVIKNTGKGLWNGFKWIDDNVHFTDALATMIKYHPVVMLHNLKNKLKNKN